MSKIAYSFNAFKRRVAMSKDAVFIIVEGHKLDVAYYDSLAASDSNIATAGYQIHSAEQISRPDGKAAGGKRHVLSLFDALKHQRALQFQNSIGPKALFFALDRDYDFVTGGTRRSPHVIYTRCADIEAEVFWLGDDQAALRSSLALSIADAAALSRALATWRSDLANTWKEWITLCCQAEGVKARCAVRSSSPSWINRNKYGPVDSARQIAAESQINAQAAYIGDAAKRRSLVRKRVEGYFTKGEEERLLKGKLLPDYLLERIQSARSGAPSDYDGFKGAVAKFYLASIDFGHPHVQSLQNHIRAVAGV